LTVAPTGWVLHLLRRTTYGATPSSIADVTARGATAWLERQLKPWGIADARGDAIRALYPEAGWTIAQVYRQVAAGNIGRYSWDVMQPLGQYSLAMATWSSRQLYEVMVEFWSNHLNVANPSDGVWDNRQDYDRRVIRAHALGRFSDMLAASAAHPAMLRYLNQADSTGAAPNENYGRELLELHTVGVDAGYTEAMVLDSARIMTGYTVQWDDSKPHLNEFVYDPSIHWKGAVRVLGFRHRNASADGREVVAAYLSHLAHHPATARHIARKLAVRFVSDDPSTALINRLAAVYLAHDTAIVPVLRALFASHEFLTSRKEKVRRPYEDLIATLRTLDYQLLPRASGATARRKGPEALYWIAQSLQQAPLAWVQPDGYPDVAQSWTAAGGLLNRWNMHQNLAAGWWPGKDRIAVPPSSALLPRRLTTYGALVHALAVRLTGEPLPRAEAAAVLAFLAKAPAARVRADDAAVAWDLGRTVALLLDSANHELR
jgi:ribosomal protein L34